jgi:hypothetical protein
MFTVYPLKCLISTEFMGSDLVNEEATIACLLCCDKKKNTIKDAYYCFQCEVLHCLADKRNRFSKNQIGVRTVVSEYV